MRGGILVAVLRYMSVCLRDPDEGHDGLLCIVSSSQASGTSQLMTIIDRIEALDGSARHPPHEASFSDVVLLHMSSVG